MKFQGIFAIPLTPFTSDGALDIAVQRRVVDFCVEKGAHGIVGPIIASEYYALSDEERYQVAEVLVEQTAGRLPVLIGVTATSREMAVRFARHAREIGADGIIAMPPYARRDSMDRVYEFYLQIYETSGLPIVIQNSSDQVGTPMPADVVARLAEEIGKVYLKSEIFPAHNHQISRFLKACSPHIHGIFGGMGGRWLMDEMRRGIAGTMVACEVVDVHVKVWEAYQAGDEAMARKIFNVLLPLLNLESLLTDCLTKEVLKRRGVIESTYVRIPAGCTLDDDDHYELDQVMTDLEPYFVRSQEYTANHALTRKE